MRFSLRTSLALECRGSARVRPPPGAQVQVQIMGPNSLDIVNARDISATGIGVWVPHGFEPATLDSEIELVITLPGERPFLACGALRHASDRPGAYFGVELTQVADRHRDRIRAYVARHLDP